MSKDVVTLLLTSVVLVGGGGLSLGALALGSSELAYSILGFAGGLLGGVIFPRIQSARGEE